MGTSGSEGGQQKPTSRKTGRALLSDPYTYLATGRAGCTCARSATAAPAASSAGPSKTTSAPT